jgi:hypothetical protein
MKITVERYNTKTSIKVDHDDVEYSDFMELIMRISIGVGYSSKTVEDYWEKK